MECRICCNRSFEKVVDLGNQPWGNNFLTSSEIGSEPFYPLNVIYCCNCQAAQLDFTVRKEIMFSDHTYLSGVTKSLNDHFHNIATEVNNSFFSTISTKNVLDIGSNDGSQLKCYKKLGYDVLGVESSKRISEIANQNEIPTLHAFFNFETAKALGRKFNVINASGVFFHLEELHSVTDGIKLLLDDNGVFVVQFLYMKSIIDNTAFDQIYHEHLLYYTLKTIQTLLNLHGLEIFDAHLSPIHGGSVIAFASHIGKYEKSNRLSKMQIEEELSNCNELESYLEFSRKIKALKEFNLKFLTDKKSQNKTIFGLGAPVKGNTLLNYFNIGTDIISFLVEKNSLRKGLFSPGKHIPIILENEMLSQPDIYYVLAWNFKDEIIKNNKHLIEQGVEFYFPINPK